ncbi:MAG: PEP-CTERM sorting domain-containing protein [Planctomycetales bacterium]|nr:PEP-CTERM sorting domain-containing protein [Planctomycetales bacterium]
MKRVSVWKIAVVCALCAATARGDKLLFIGGQPDPTQGDDSFVFDHLEELGHDVTYLAANESTTADGEDVDAIILSSTFGSGDARGKFQDLAVPILQWEEALVRWDHGNPDGNFRMSEFSRNGQGRETTVIKILESAVGHPLTAGLDAGVHEIFDDFNRTPQQFGELAPGLILIAEIDPDFAEDGTVYVNHDGEEVDSALVLTAIDAGGELGPAGEGHIAPARRVNFPVEDVGFGSLNETGIALFDCSLEWVLGRNCLGGGVEGDFDNSGQRDPADLDLLAAAMASGDPAFDLNGDGAVNLADRVHWVVDLTNTYIGDSNFDGQFNSSDFVAVFGTAKYETGQPATWGEGDWNGDGLFNSADFVAAFGGGGYEGGERAGGLMVVPEPSSIALFTIGLLAFAARRRR